MNPLTADTVIAVASGVKVEFRDAGTQLCLGQATFDAGTRGLAVLDLFRLPRTMAAAMGELSAREREPKVWMEVSATIYALWAAGLLREATAPPAEPKSRPLVKSGVHAQARMMNDRARTHGFLRAIRDTVKPGDVVVDIGTGTGVLSIAAAKAGAEHVYAIEMTGMADVAEAMFAANGLSDRITVLRGRSNDLELPDGAKANVLVTETIGDQPFGEFTLESVTDARRRLLVPGARVIPVGIDVGVVPLRLPRDLLERYIFTAQNAEEWKRDYEIDFSATLRPGDGSDLSPDLAVYRLRTADYLRCETLAAPTRLAHVDFARHPDNTVEGTAQVTVENSGPLHGFAMYFDLDIGAGQTLSTAPAGSQAVGVTQRNAWRIPIWLRLQPLDVGGGEVFTVNFNYSEQGTKLEVRRA